jgi:hypothetical protein
VEQELLTVSEHLGSPPVFIRVGVARSFVFYVITCISLFVFFLLAIVLSFFQFMAFENPFGILTFFLENVIIYIIKNVLL